MVGQMPDGVKGMNAMERTDSGVVELVTRSITLDDTVTRDDCVTVCYAAGATIVRGYVPVADLLEWERDHISVPVEVFTEIPEGDEPARLIRAAGWTNDAGVFHYYTTICAPGLIAEAMP
jgi:hypothetical protein